MTARVERIAAAMRESGASYPFAIGYIRSAIRDGGQQR